jgi:hypothetical protein
MEMLTAAQLLLALTDPPGSSAGKYRVDLREARGVQGGRQQHAIQHLPATATRLEAT